MVYEIVMQVWNKPVAIVMDGMPFNAVTNDLGDIVTSYRVTEYYDATIELNRFNNYYRIAFTSGSGRYITGMKFTGVADLTNTSKVVKYDGGLPSMR